MALRDRKRGESGSRKYGLWRRRPGVRHPEPPQHLNVDGATMWKDLGPQLVAAKVLQVVDLYALQQLCYAWQRAVAKQKAGMDITAAEDTALKALLSEFGMTPASRRKVAQGGADKKTGNKFGALGKPG